MKEIKLPGLEETIYLYTHKSGLKCYFWSNEKVNGTYMTLSVKYGSVHTEFKIGNKKYKVPNGLAHFLEHVKFNESENTTAHDFYCKTGADANAFTTFDYTNYIVFATSNIEENLQHLLDFVYTPFFNKKLIQKEKGIIIEEANMSNDDVSTNSYFRHLKNIFKEYNYREIITGEPEDIKAITLEDVELVFKTFYHPENMYLCVTGNINPYQMAKIVDEAMEGKEFATFKDPIVLKPKEPKEVLKEYDAVEINVMNERVRYAVKLSKSKFKDIDDFTLQMMLSLIMNINFGNTSDFKDELINKGLVTNLYYSVDFFDDYIVLLLVAETEYDEEIIKRIEAHLNNLEIDEASFHRKVKANLASLILEFDDIENVNARIQDNLIRYGEYIYDIFDRLKTLSLETTIDIAQRISTQNKAILVIKPQKK